MSIITDLLSTACCCGPFNLFYLIFVAFFRLVFFSLSESVVLITLLIVSNLLYYLIRLFLCVSSAFSCCAFIRYFWSLNTFGLQF